MNKKRNLIMYFGLMVGLIGVVLYDPLGFLFNGAGLIIIGMGLGCWIFGYKYKRSNWGNTMIGQSILWATAILITAISESKEFTIFLLVILGTCSTLLLRKKLNEIKRRTLWM